MTLTGNKLYHYSTDVSEYRECKATVKICPFADQPHFEGNYTAAQLAELNTRHKILLDSTVPDEVKLFAYGKDLPTPTIELVTAAYPELFSTTSNEFAENKQEDTAVDTAANVAPEISNPELLKCFERWKEAKGHTLETTTYDYGLSDIETTATQQEIEEYIAARNHYATQERTKALANELGYSPEDYELHLKDRINQTVNDVPLIIRVKDTSILEEIIEAGQILGSRDYWGDDESDEDTNSRLSNEKVWFNWTYDCNPVYGSFSREDNDILNHSYGDINIVMKKDRLLEYTSVTLGDSLNAVSYGIQPYRLNSPTAKGVGGAVAANVTAKETMIVNIGQDRVTDKYLEAQILAPVGTSDIEKIHIGENTYMDYYTYEKLLNTGIPITYDCDIYDDEGIVIPRSEILRGI